MSGYRHEKVPTYKAADILTGAQIAEEFHEYELRKNEEFRFEVDFEQKIEIQVIKSLSRLFLTHLAAGW